MIQSCLSCNVFVAMVCFEIVLIIRVFSVLNFNIRINHQFHTGEIIAADNFTGRPERMVEALKKVRTLKWICLPIKKINRH